MKNKVNMTSISNKIKFIYGDECEKNTVGIVIFSDGTNYFFDAEYKNKMSNEEVEALLLRGASIYKDGKYVKPSSFDNNDISFKETENSINDKVNSFKRDKLGLKSINIIGDSISHGSNSIDIYENSWVSIFRKAIQLETQCFSHGFVNLQTPIGAGELASNDILSIDLGSSWKKSNSSYNLGNYYIYTNVANAEVSITISNIDNKILDIIYQQGTSVGSFEVYINGALSTTVNTKGSQTEYIAFTRITSDETIKEIKIKHISGTSIISGLVFLDRTDDIVVNNYSRSGLRLAQEKDNVLDFIMDTNIVFICLGHNDSSDNTISIKDFTAKIDTIKSLYDIYEPYVIVCDFIWNDSYADYVEQLKNLANYCNGKYIDFWKVNDARILIDAGYLSDTSHPSPLGMKIIAEKILNKLNITHYTKKQMINAQINIGDIKKLSTDNRTIVGAINEIVAILKANNLM